MLKHFITVSFTSFVFTAIFLNFHKKLHFFRNFHKHVDTESVIFFAFQILESSSNAKVVSDDSRTTKKNSKNDISNQKEHYLTFAQKTYGLIKFVKVAYPDLVAGQSPENLVEPLLEKNKQACRYIQGVPIENCHKQMAVALKRYISNPLLVKPKCV